MAVVRMSRLASPPPKHPPRAAEADALSVRLVCAAAIAGIFAIDLKAPLGLGVPFLYLLVALFAIAKRQSDATLLAIAVLSTSLAAGKLLFSGMGGVLHFGQANRLIFAVLIWAAVGLEMGRREIGRNLERLVQERTEALHLANVRLQSMANQLVEAQEVERKRLAAELHDRIGQNLSALNINLNLNLSQLCAETVPKVKARMRDSLSLLEKTTEMVRGVMEELHPALLDQYGLGTALRWYGEEFSRRTGIAVANAMPEPFPRLRDKVETTLFRIVQEALTNVAKHAGAGQVTVALARIAGGVELVVADDGVGMDPGRTCSQAAGSGWGLAIMAERARSVGAGFRISAQPGQGTRIEVHIANGLWETTDDHHGTDR